MLRIEVPPLSLDFRLNLMEKEGCLKLIMFVFLFIHTVVRS